jgi:hypothetical protein
MAKLTSTLLKKTYKSEEMPGTCMGSITCLTKKSETISEETHISKYNGSTIPHAISLSIPLNRRFKP